ncbi:MAG: diaminopimelate epimerase [Bacteroidales bacterium]
MYFWKFHGNGNDFIIIDNRHKEKDDLPKTIANLCDRHMGIGADGLISLHHTAQADFSMRYYNADGKEGSMCGNGGRCIVAYAKMRGIITSTRTRFIAIDGEHHASILRSSSDLWEISLKMNDVSGATTKFNDTGSPHHIEFVQDITGINVIEKGKEIRHRSSYSPIGGVNVNFLAIKEGKLHLRTYERGVEDETLSCGTGAIAAALAYAVKQGITNGPVTVNTSGGPLQVDFSRKQNTFTNIWLTGSARYIFKGETL